MATEANAGASNLIPPVQGEVRNPNGRPKGVPNRKTILNYLLFESNLEDLIEPDKKPKWWDKVKPKNLYEAMTMAMAVQAMSGDTKSFNALNHALGDQILNEQSLSVVHIYKPEKIDDIEAFNAEGARLREHTRRAVESEVIDIEQATLVVYNVAMIKCICECGVEYITYPSRIIAGRGKYCSRRCSDKYTLIKKGQRLSARTEFVKGQMPHNYKGYKFTQARPQSGIYKQIYKPEHPFATKSGHVREHRLVMEEQLGRYLRSDEVIAHINMDTLDNRPENLRVMLKVDHDKMNTKLNVHRRWQKGVQPHE